MLQYYNMGQHWCLCIVLNFVLFIYLFIYLFLAVLGLCCCTGLFSSLHEWGLFPNCSAQAPHCSAFCCCRAETLGCVWLPGSRALLFLPLLLLPSIFPSIRVFSNELVLCIRWPKYWSFSFSISPSSEYSGLISFSIDWSDLLAIQGTLKSLLQHHSLKALILQC